MKQQVFEDLFRPALAPVETPAPFQSGSHASWTGAVCADEGPRTEKIAVLRQLYQSPKTRQEVAGITGWPINSICSLTDALSEELEIVDYERVDWGSGRKSTSRERLQLKQKERV